MLSKWQFWVVVGIALASIFAYKSSIPPDTIESPSPSKVAFVTGGSGEYWHAAVAGAKAAAAELGIELDVRMPERAESVEEQVQILSTLTTSPTIDAVAVSPLDPDEETTVINVIAAAKPVVTYDSDAPQSTRQGYVGTSNFSAGLMSGTLVKRAIPEGGKVLVLMANTTKENLRDRKAGFQTRMAESPNAAEEPVDPRFQIVGFLADDGDSKKCAQLLKDTLDEHPDLACVVAFNARQGPVVAKTLQESGKAGEIKVVTFDTPNETLDAVEDGTVFATIAQDPYKYGYEAIVMIDNLCRGDKRYLPVVGRGAIHVSVEPIQKEDVAEFRKRTASRMTNKGA